MVSQTIEAVYDGTVLRPQTALTLDPNTRVRLIVEVMPPAEAADLDTDDETVLLDDPGRIRMPPRGVRAVTAKILAAGRQQPRPRAEEE